MYRTTTRDIEVTVDPEFLPDRSSVTKQQYAWAYTVQIHNTGDKTVQLRSRHWVITDDAGRKQEVRGVGVIGEQPVLKAGERFQYTSSVALGTSSGFMVGEYQMTSEDGEQFEINIPAFSLDQPAPSRVLN